MQSCPRSELMLAAAFEGGGFRISRLPTPKGFTWSIQTTAMTFDEQDDEVWVERTRPGYTSFDAALADVGSSWPRMSGRFVHPEVADAVWRYVDEFLAEHDASPRTERLRRKWRRACTRSVPPQ